MGITFDEPLAINKKHFKNVASFLRYLEENNLLVDIHEVQDSLVPEVVKQEALAAKKDLETGIGFIHI